MSKNIEFDFVLSPKDVSEADSDEHPTAHKLQKIAGLKYRARFLGSASVGSPPLNNRQ